MRRPRRGWRRPKAFSQSIGTAGQNAPTGSERRPTIFPRKISGSAAVEEHHPEHVRRADSEGAGHAEEAMRVEAVFLGQRAWLVTPVCGSQEQVADADPRHGCGCRVCASGRVTPMLTMVTGQRSAHHEAGLDEKPVIVSMARARSSCIGLAGWRFCPRVRPRLRRVRIRWLVAGGCPSLQGDGGRWPWQ